MKKIISILLAATLALGLSACGQKGSVGVVGGDGSADILSKEDSLVLPSSSDAEDAADGEQDGYNEVHRASYDMYLRKYIVPYGNLKFYDKDWTNAADLGVERVFEFTLQKNFNFYASAMDYAAVFGDEFTYLQVPETWFDENHGCVYPQDIIENTSVEYFGLDAAFMRTANAYLPAQSGYGAPTPMGGPSAQTAASSTAELLPAVTSIRRKGARAEITFTLSPCDPAGKLIEGDVITKVMTVEDKEETFRYISVVSA